jgi:hypothetical protein
MIVRYKHIQLFFLQESSPATIFLCILALSNPLSQKNKIRHRHIRGVAWLGYEIVWMHHVPLLLACKRA